MNHTNLDLVWHHLWDIVNYWSNWLAGWTDRRTLCNSLCKAAHNMLHSACTASVNSAINNAMPWSMIDCGLCIKWHLNSFGWFGRSYSSTSNVVLSADLTFHPMNFCLYLYWVKCYFSWHEAWLLKNVFWKCEYLSKLTSFNGQSWGNNVKAICINPVIHCIKL